MANHTTHLPVDTTLDAVAMFSNQLCDRLIVLENEVKATRDYNHNQDKEVIEGFNRLDNSINTLNTELKDVLTVMLTETIQPINARLDEHSKALKTMEYKEVNEVYELHKKNVNARQDIVWSIVKTIILTAVGAIIGAITVSIK